jgi:hypothetical protein
MDPRTFFTLKQIAHGIPSRIPSIVDACWALLLNEKPLAGYQYRRIYLPAYFEYKQQNYVEWESSLDQGILEDLKEIHDNIVLRLQPHPDPLVFAFVEERAQNTDPTINFSYYYQNLFDMLDTAIVSKDGTMREGALASFNHVLLSVIITFFHELKHVYLRWVRAPSLAVYTTLKVIPH